MRSLGGFLAIFALLALAGCGSGGEETTRSPAAETPRSTTTTTPEKQARHGNEKGAAPKPEEERQHTAEGEPTPGSRAVAPGVPVTKGGDNSIQAFGAEGDEDQRSQALADLNAYLSALRAGQWSRACTLASGQFKAELIRLFVRAKGKEKPEGCAAGLEAIFGNAPQGAIRERSPAGELLSFRIRGHYAYLIYRGAKGRAMFAAMASDGGRWKVNVPQPTPFSEITQGSIGQ